MHQLETGTVQDVRSQAIVTLAKILNVPMMEVRE
jgi:hypothetical protein